MQGKSGRGVLFLRFRLSTVQRGSKSPSYYYGVQWHAILRVCVSKFFKMPLSDRAPQCACSITQLWAVGYISLAVEDSMTMHVCYLKNLFGKCMNEQSKPLSSELAGAFSDLCIMCSSIPIYAEKAEKKWSRGTSQLLSCCIHVQNSYCSIASAVKLPKSIVTLGSATLLLVLALWWSGARNSGHSLTLFPREHGPPAIRETLRTQK